MTYDRYIIRLLILLTIFTAMQSCDNGEEEIVEEGTVSFTFEVISDENEGGRTEALIPTTIVLSIEDLSGNPIYTLEELDIFEFNGSYVSEPLILEVGDYQLTEYLVRDDVGATIYATPVEGSELDYLVNDPLPIALTVAANQSTQLAPQVISTETLTPADFGYTDSNFEFIETFDFLMSVFVFNETTEAFEATSGQVTISGDGVEIYNNAFSAGVVQIKLIDGYTNYTVSVTKSGYLVNNTTLTNAEMKATFTDPIVIQLATPPTNYALSLSAGNQDYIRIPEASELDLSDGAFTIEFWAATGATGNSFLGKDNDNGTLDYQIAVGPGGGWNFRGQGISGFGIELDAPSFLGHNVYHHIAITYDGSTALMYIDGSVVSTDNTPGTPTLNDFDLVIGGRSGGPNGPIQFWTGEVDEFRIWNVARTSTEINNNMNNSLVGDEAGLIVYYDFNDGPGSSILTDRTGGNDGTLVNFDVNTDWVTNTPF